jgi:hypothetical protein
MQRSLKDTHEETRCEPGGAPEKRCWSSLEELADGEAFRARVETRLDTLLRD